VFRMVRIDAKPQLSQLQLGYVRTSNMGIKSMLLF
jgi:hypothetical protein